MAPPRDRTNPGGRKLVASNRRAQRDYDILETFETGIVLNGSEVKALRVGHAQVADAFARIINNQIWMDGVHIPPYQFAHGIGAHDTDRARKLLMHRREIDRLSHALAVEHLALIPLSFYFKEGLVKVELGLARGRKKADKRQALAERDTKLEIARAMSRQAKGRQITGHQVTGRRP